MHVKLCLCEKLDVFLRIFHDVLEYGIMVHLRMPSPEELRERMNILMIAPFNTHMVLFGATAQNIANYSSHFKIIIWSLIGWK